jgi:hypothetical protein
MEIVIGDLLTIEGKQYITLEKLTYEGNEYIFVNKIINEEEVSDEFYIFKIVDEGVRIIVEDDLRNTLITKFEELLKKDIKELLQEN